MGQYYRGVVLGKTTKKAEKIIVREAFCPYAHDNGAKLMEHSYVGNWYVKEYERTLANEFFGFPFVWAGDYADEKFGVSPYFVAGDFVKRHTKKNARKLGYRKVAKSSWGREYVKNGMYCSETDVAVKTPYEELKETTYEVIINFDKQLFVRIPKKKGADENGNYQLTIHPLPLLCVDGNQRGGGDYYGSNEKMVGTWAYDRIGVGFEDDIPVGFKELVVTFDEAWGNKSLRNINDWKIVG